MPSTEPPPTTLKTRGWCASSLLLTLAELKTLARVGIFPPKRKISVHLE